MVRHLGIFWMGVTAIDRRLGNGPLPCPAEAQSKLDAAYAFRRANTGSDEVASAGISRDALEAPRDCGITPLDVVVVWAFCAGAIGVSNPGSEEPAEILSIH